MTNEEIIKNWKQGKTVEQISKDYMNQYNKQAKIRKEAKINIKEAQMYVEPIIFEFETMYF